MSIEFRVAEDAEPTLVILVPDAAPTAAPPPLVEGQERAATLPADRRGVGGHRHPLPRRRPLGGPRPQVRLTARSRLPVRDRRRGHPVGRGVPRARSLCAVRPDPLRRVPAHDQCRGHRPRRDHHADLLVRGVSLQVMDGRDTGHRSGTRSWGQDHRTSRGRAGFEPIDRWYCERWWSATSDPRSS